MSNISDEYPFLFPLIGNSDLMIRLDSLWKCLSIDQLFTLAVHVHRYTQFTCWAKRVKILYINIIEYRMVSLSWQIFNICQSFLSKRWWNVAKMGTTSGQRYRIYWNSIGMRHWFLNCMAASTSNMLLPIYFSVLIWPRSSEILTATDERPWDISHEKSRNEIYLINHELLKQINCKCKSLVWPFLWWIKPLIWVLAERLNAIFIYDDVRENVIFKSRILRITRIARQSYDSHCNDKCLIILN